MPRLPTLNNAELLQQFNKNGNQKAFGQLVDRHINMVYNSALRRTPNRQIAEEATQNVFLKLSHKSRQLEKKSQFLTGWLHLSARYEVNNLMRKESRLKKRETTYARLSSDRLTEKEESIFVQSLPMIEQVIDKLRPSDREAILLRFYEDQSLRAIGNHLGISEDAAQKRISRTLERMAQLLKRHAKVSISTAVLTTGLQHQQLHAAPAACLSTSKALASVGTTTFVSSSNIIQSNITTFVMNKAIVTTAVVVALGAASAPFILNHSKDKTSTSRTAGGMTASRDQPQIKDQRGARAATRAQNRERKNRALFAILDQAFIGATDMESAMDLWRNTAVQDYEGAIAWLNQVQWDNELAYGFYDRLLFTALAEILDKDPNRYFQLVDKAITKDGTEAGIQLLDMFPEDGLDAKQISIVEAWIKDQSDPRLQLKAARLLLRGTASANPKGSLEWVDQQSFTKTPGATDLRRVCLSAWISEDVSKPAGLQDVCSYLLNNKDIPDASLLLSETINAWATGDFDKRLVKAGEWLAKQEPKPALDLSYASYALRISLHDDQWGTALTWAEHISDKKLREKTRMKINQVRERKHSAP